MLNCVNALEQHLPVMEQAGLVVAEEKSQQDSCKTLYQILLVRCDEKFCGKLVLARNLLSYCKLLCLVCLLLKWHAIVFRDLIAC